MASNRTPDLPLDEQVRALLDARRGEWKLIMAELGGKPSYSWIDKFMNGRIVNPGFNTLQTLQRHLQNRAPSQPAKTKAAERKA